jgi:thiopeptide-type bacteriocin biosynthesis protein
MANASFLPADFIGMRTALLPWETFSAWSAGLTVQGDAEPSLDEARAELRARLRELLLNPILREAIFIASPDLDQALVHWFEDPDGEKGLRAERSLVRYFSRMCGRSTPFGLFAGCSVGRVGERTDLCLSGQENYLRHTRLDMDYLCTLAETLAKDPTLRQELLYRPNSSLYASGGRLRYAEGRLKNKARSYHLVAVEESPYLLATLERAKSGASLRTLATALVDEDITLEEAEGFILELIDSQLIVPDLHPAVTGPEPVHDLIAQLKALPDGAHAAWILEGAKDALTAIDQEALGLSKDHYLKIADNLRTLPAKVELNRLFQTDLVKPAPETVVGREVLAEVERGVALLQRLSNSGGKDALSRFKEAFSARYDSQEIPLVEALDEESGIGFDTSQGPGSDASPLLEGLAFPGDRGEGTAAWTAKEAFLLQKVMALATTKGMVLCLTEDELKPLETKQPLSLPESFSAMARLATSSAEALAAGDFKVTMSGISGPSGANLLGRFCHGDEALTEKVLGYRAAEEARQPDAVHAEIVHLPEGRIGNVLLRPLLRGYEIPFLGRSGAPEENQIPVTDLLLSIRGGRIVLRSRRLDKEVLPRLTNAHNYSFRSLGLYRFLCMLQHQGVAGGLGWSWGVLDSLPFLPRVEVGRLVFAKARWKIETKVWKKALEAEGAERWKAVQAMRAELNLPRLVVLVDGDNKLPVDLDNVLSVEACFDLVKKRSSFTLEEFYPGSDELCAEGPEGRFVHELVVPFTLSGEVNRPRGKGPAEAATGPRSFAPGSEWLYVKLYAGSAGVDQLLRERVAPLVRDVLASGVADGWFFIRYSDPDWHLRLRFHGDPTRLASELLPRLEALSGAPVRKLVVDTYDREFERYGGDEGMGLSERLFQIDSEAVLRILETSSGDVAADLRWRLCLKGMDLLLDDLGFDTAAKHTLMGSIRAGFVAEFHAEGAFERQLGDRFRKERRALEALLDPAKEGQGDLAEGVALLRRRSKDLKPVMDSLRGLAAEGRLGVSLEELAGSYLHMHANRFLRASARAQELVLYDFLLRHYESQLARVRKKAEALEEV